MLIFLYGPDTYRTREKLKEIIERYKKIHKSGLSLKLLDLKEKNFQDFDQEFRSASMFREKKLIILKNTFSDSDFKEKFLKKKKNYKNSEDIILFFEEDTLNKNNSLFKFLKEFGKSQEFNFLTGQKLKNFLRKEFEKNNSEIKEDALEKLIEYVGNDLWRFSNEIKKLAAFTCPLPAAPGRAKGTLTKISKKDVELLVQAKIDTDIFKTIDALAEKNKKKALSLVHKHLEKGDSPFYLLTMINYQFRNLLMIKTRHQYTNETPMTRINSLSKELGIHPFVIRKATWQARRFNLEELKKIYQKIFQADYNIKTGKMEPEIALDMLIAEI